MAAIASPPPASGQTHSLFDLQTNRDCTVWLGPSISERSARDSRYYSLRYNHKPKQLKSEILPRVTGSADNCGLNLSTKNGVEFKYKGRRETSPETSMVLEFDPRSESFTLERLSASYTFNLASKTPDTEGQDMTQLYPQISPENLRPVKADRSQVNGYSSAHSRTSTQSSPSPDAGLLPNSSHWYEEPEANNPYDYHHYTKTFPPPVEESIKSVTPTPKSTPLTQPTKGSGLEAVGFYLGRNKTRNNGMTAANKKIMKGILKPSPRAIAHKRRDEQQASNKSSLQSSPTLNGRTTDRTPIPEVHLPPSSPPMKKRRLSATDNEDSNMDAASSDNELVIDMGDGPSRAEVQAARDEWYRRRDKGLLGTPRSAALGPVSMRSAAASAQASPALVPSTVDDIVQENRRKTKGLGITMDRTRSGKANEDVDEIDIGSPRHETIVDDSNKHTPTDDLGPEGEGEAEQDDFSLALQEAINKVREEGEDEEDGDDDANDDDHEEQEEVEDEETSLSHNRSATRDDSEESEEE